MPPPTGVVSGPLMPTRNSLKASTVSSGSQVLNCLKALLAGEDLEPGDFAFAAVGLLDGGVEDPLAGGPDVRPGAVAANEGNDGMVGNVEFALGNGDFAARRWIDVFVGHFKKARVRHWVSRRICGHPRRPF